MNNTTVINPTEFEFNRRLLMNILAYSLMFFIGTIGNLVVFVAAYKQHVSPENQHGRRNNVHIMVVHLTIADLIVSFVVMPLEIGWRISVQWVAGNLACKILMFIRAFAFYLSSMTLVSLSLDRYLAIAQPMASLKMNKTRKRGRIMIMAAWLVASLFAAPQTLVFRVLKHPQIEFFQCTSMNFFTEIMSREKMLSNGTMTNETIMFLGLGPEMLEKMYSCIFLITVYMVPLLVIVITYANILCKIIRKKQESRNESNRASSRLELHHYSSSNSTAAAPGYLSISSNSNTTRSTHCSNHSSFESCHQAPNLRMNSVHGSVICRNRSLRFARSQTVALRMSTMHVLAFVGCWTPYLVISLWHVIDPNSVEQVEPEVQDALFLTAVFNSCINPLVYGGFYLKAMRKAKRQTSGTRRTLHPPTLLQSTRSSEVALRNNSSSNRKIECLPE